jgi:hypothetical protein
MRVLMTLIHCLPSSTTFIAMCMPQADDTKHRHFDAPEWINFIITIIYSLWSCPEETTYTSIIKKKLNIKTYRQLHKPEFTAGSPRLDWLQVFLGDGNASCINANKTFFFVFFSLFLAQASFWGQSSLYLWDRSLTEGKLPTVRPLRTGSLQIADYHEETW